MQDKIYDNAGELTRRCLDLLFEDDYTFLDDETANEDDYLHTYPCKIFSDGLTESLVSHGYTGDKNSVEDKTAFVKNKCIEKHIPLNPTNIRNWLTDKRPISGGRSRELIYQLCFALEFTLEDVTEFFLKVYFDCPFNFRDHRECVYYFCFENSLGYTDALRLIEQTEKILDSHADEKPILEYTHMIGSALKSIHTEKELFAYIEKNSNEFFSEQSYRLQIRCRPDRRDNGACTADVSA